MNRYSAYKDSGVEWIGEIPEHWDVKKMTHLFNQIGSGSTPKSDFLEYYENGDFNWLQTGDLTDGYINKTSKKITSRAVSECNMKFFGKDSLVVAMYGATIGKTGILQIETSTNQACCVLSEPNNVKTKFAHYWFVLNKLNIISLGYGGGQPNISQDIIKSLRVQYPPLHEQEQIVSYLDKKTAIVDTLITSKAQKINLLKENRTALINHVITKGLNPNVKLKDSGVEWIGEIPEHWEVKKMKYFVKICNGSDFKDFSLEEGGFPVYGSGGVFSRSSKFIYDKISVLLGRKGSVGKPKIVEEPFWCSDTTYYTKIYENVNPFYFFFLVQQIKFDLYTYGSAIPSMTKSVYDEMLFPYPKVEEQEQIVEYLDTHIQEIDELISLEGKKIATLKEYRQALISEVVTGKIKVVN